ncbi:hypothetical protein [Glacieibacterium sp.]|uniref:hypothetical protein n=1 Tax=Glacieibacterium sp. TaxID=2860237 RepID=UPI003B00AF20
MPSEGNSLHDVNPPRAYVVDLGLVSDMARRCASQTAFGLTNQFGISWNTWSKLRKGQPIRRSVALRLVSRVLAEAGHGTDPMSYLKVGDDEAR